MRLPFGLSTYSRANGRLAPVRLINLIVETSPTSPGGAVALPRPGLSEFADRPNRGLYREDGAFDGHLFEVSGDDLYRNGTSVFSGLAGDDLAEWAYTVDGLFILSGGVVYQYDGTTTEATEFPDDAAVASICQIDNILLAVRADTGNIYFRLAGDTTWGALDVLAAERRPDPVLAVRPLGDRLFAFGAATIEIFYPTGETEVPFQRIDGTVINRGLKDRDSLSLLDNTLFFVGEDNQAYRITDAAPQIISDNGVAERIAGSETAKSFPYVWQGHTLYVLGLDAETVAFDVGGGWTTYTHGEESFPKVGLYDGVQTFVGGAKVWTLEDRPDDDGAAMERLFTAILPTDTPVSCDCLEVQLAPGLTEIGSEPAIVQMRWTDDQGRSWTDWKDASTGFGGDYRKRVRYRRLGMADAPGRAFEIRQTDPVALRFSGCDLNPPGGGRSR